MPCDQIDKNAVASEEIYFEILTSTQNLAETTLNIRFLQYLG